MIFRKIKQNNCRNIQRIIKVIGHCNNLLKCKRYSFVFPWRLRCLGSFIHLFLCFCNFSNDSYRFLSSKSEEDEKKTTENAVELWSEKSISTEDRWYLSPGKTLITPCVCMCGSCIFSCGKTLTPSCEIKLYQNVSY